MWVGGLLIVILGLILYKHIVLVLASPFMSPLAQKVEEHLTGNYTKYSGTGVAVNPDDSNIQFYYSPKSCRLPDEILPNPLPKNQIVHMLVHCMDSDP